ncbi:MAG: hypothetical protein ACJ74P_10755 [Gaiellaceae bacterium]
MTRRLAAAIGVVLLVAGCGGSDNSAEKDVSAYIQDVNSIQHGLSLPLGQVALGYRQLATGSDLPAMQPKLAKSALTIRKLERRVDALDPPPEAIRLDATIRRLVHGESQLAEELALLVAYVHDAAPVLARATAAGKSLHDALSAPRTRAAQATALEAYAAPLDTAAKQLAKLEAPPVVAPSQRTQIQTYRLIAARARALASALRDGKSGAQQVHDLQLAVATSASTQAQKARIAAIKAFNRRTAKLRGLEADAQRERNRLERILS